MTLLLRRPRVITQRCDAEPERAFQIAIPSANLIGCGVAPPTEAAVPRQLQRKGNLFSCSGRKARLHQHQQRPLCVYFHLTLRACCVGT